MSIMLSINIVLIILLLNYYIKEINTTINNDNDDDRYFGIDGFINNTKQWNHGNKLQSKFNSKNISYHNGIVVKNGTSYIDNNNYDNNNKISLNHSNINKKQIDNAHNNSMINSSQNHIHTTTNITNKRNNDSNVNNVENDLSDIVLTNVTDKRIPNLFKGNYKIVAFYNLFAGDIFYHDIVKSQMNRILKNKLLDRLDAIFYATMGKNGEHLKIGLESYHQNKYKHIAYYGKKGEEIQTISLLYQFCQIHKDSKVLYFHDKGSFHNDYRNRKFCDLLNCYVLNTYCIDVLDNHDLCGWRLSPMPVFHYSGNFWWARCDYINTLINPLSPYNNKTWIKLDATYNECVHTKERYFAEGWVGSGPNVHPADCMNTSVDTSYIFGYQFPSIADKYCPSLPYPSGFPCQTAAIIENPLAFKKSIAYMSSISPSHCLNIDKMIIKKSYDWYGEYPYTYMNMSNTLKKI